MHDSTGSIIVQCAHGYSRLVARTFGLKLTYNHDGHQHYTNQDSIMIAPPALPSEIMIRTGFAMGMLFEQPGPGSFGHREAILILEQRSLMSVSLANAVMRDKHRRPYYPDILLRHDLPECTVHDTLAEAFIQTVEAYVPPHGVSVLAVPALSDSEGAEVSDLDRKRTLADLQKFRNYRQRVRDTYPPEVYLTSEEIERISSICGSARLHRNQTVLIRKAALARRVRAGSVPLDDMQKIADKSQNQTSQRNICVKRIIELLEHDLARW
ncbi:MAG: hypothetical protein ACLFNQ_09305 [Spirochaetaceae bacterium]